GRDAHAGAAAAGAALAGRDLFRAGDVPVPRHRVPGPVPDGGLDGCKSVKVPDTPRNRGWLGKLKASPGETGCPVIQLMTLCETGTRALVGAVFGTPADGELAWARKLPGLLDETMLVLMDRGFDAGEFLAEVAATRAQFLVRLTSARRPPVLAHLPDGSFLSLIGGVKVRIIAAEVTVTCADGTDTAAAAGWPAPSRVTAPAPRAPSSGSITSGGVRREVARCEWSRCLEVPLLKT